MKYIYIILFTGVLIGNSFAQSVKDIKNNPEQYIWGEGKGITLDEADQNALRFLVSSISTHVESEYKQNTEWGTGKEYFENVEMMVRTYSSATLNNTERIVISNEPDAHVFRYIKRDDVQKIFENRTEKLKEFIKTGIKAEENLRIADALKNYYWAFNLLKSLPNNESVYMQTKQFDEMNLLSWIPDHMNTIFSKITFKPKEDKTEDNLRTVILAINYEGKAVTNLDYSYWTGNDWTNLISAKDGIGFLEFVGAAQDVKNVKLKVEYLFKGEAIIDKELEMVMKNVRSVPFKASYFNIPLGDEDEVEAKVKVEKENKNEILKNEKASISTDSVPPESSSEAKDPDKQQSAVAQATVDKKIESNKDFPGKKNVSSVIQAITNHQEVDKKLFTAEGYQTYTKLLQYGKAKVLEQTEMKEYELNNHIIYRGTPMSFSFENNNKQFVETVVWYVDKESALIDNVTFSLTNVALNSIWEKTIWSEKDRLILINFLEHYKTAYALEQLDYIRSIFADDALIITGYYTFEVKKDNKTDYSQHRVVKYNRYSKEQYIQKLEYSFNSKEYINLKFEESEIRKGGNDSIYGIQIKQSYYSSNYGDVGYLFLMADLANPEKPVIHVRTWQPEKNNGLVFGLEDF